MKGKDPREGAGMGVPNDFVDPFELTLEEVDRRIAELAEQRRRIWQSSVPHTGTGETGRRALAAIEAELEELYRTKRELLARRANGNRTPKLRRRTGPTPPAGLFRDD
ncbi:MAG: hypothetical protein RMM30_00350 [Armatimonadota bacterium]|nr:hypothetical protein [Armatimonadota bacterium]MDW8155027.1 hypothetical protein [Armatimonadota bacterium]